METRAHHLLIGGFMIIMVVSLLMFILWLAKVDIDQEFAEYDIYFEESVAGLTKASVVQYNGIPVGQVKMITIDPTDPNRVLVRVEIQSGIAIYQDSIAVLALQGITGVAFVQIEGGTAGSPKLIQTDDGTIPVIESKTSAIQELFSGAPDLINQGISAVSRISELLNDQNRAHIGSILANIDTVTGNLAAGSEDAGMIAGELRQAIADFQGVATAMEDLANSVNTIVDQDVGPLMVDAVGLLKGTRNLVNTLNQIAAENKDAISAFSNGTLPEVSRLVVDARRLAVALTSLAEKLENEPGELIFAPAQPEYSPKN